MSCTRAPNFARSAATAAVFGALAALLIGVQPVVAQSPTPPAALQPVPEAATAAHRHVDTWEVTGIFGAYHAPETSLDADQPTSAKGREVFDPWSTWALGADVGRYLTPHVRIDLGLQQNMPLRTRDMERVPVAGLPAGGRVFTDKTLDLTTLSGGAAYQLRGPDAIVQPFVSAGLRLGWWREHRFRDRRVYTDYIGPYPSTPVRYTALELDERRTQWLLRPYVSLGAKFYVGRQLFIRPDVVVAMGPRGYWDATTRVGIGLTF